MPRKQCSKFMECSIRKKNPFAKDEAGATAMEFAFIAPIFIWLLFMTLEFGLMLFSRSMVESVTQKVSRQVLVGNNFGEEASRDENIETVLEKNIKAKTIGIRDIEITTNVYDRISNIGTNPSVGASRFGGRNQIVQYQVNTQYKFLTPAAQWISNSMGTTKITSTMYVKNEAF